jgi:hypothetical protein
MKNKTIIKSNSTINELSKNDELLCIYLGFFGVLIALTCLIQLFVYSNFSLIPLVLMTLYLYNIISFILLGLQKKFCA